MSETAEAGDGADDRVFCRDCGARISERAELCPECGVRQRAPPRSGVDSLVEDLTDGSNPFVAAVYSAAVPGLGQFYNREPTKGVAVFVAAIIAAFSVLALVGIVLYPAVLVYAVWDAYVVAARREAPPEEPF